MRAWYFARELARRDHRVILICHFRDGTSRTPPPADLPNLLQEHDWALPLILGMEPVALPSLSLLRKPTTPVLLRKSLVFWNYAFNSGVFGDFTRSVTTYLPAIVQEFQPDAAWGIFGNTDCWCIAKKLSELSGCPWVGDIKDSWEAFIPFSLKKILSRRFRSFACLTSNSEQSAQIGVKWFSASSRLIYSGVDDCFYTPEAHDNIPESFRVVLIGGIYSRLELERFSQGLIDWKTSSIKGRSKNLEVIYAGNDGDIVNYTLSNLSDFARVENRFYLPIQELAKLAKSASINAFNGSPHGFHHKLLELIVCGRPILIFPEASPEAQRLANRTNSKIYDGKSPADITAALDQVTDMSIHNLESRHLTEFSWPALSEDLERTFEIVTGRRLT